MSHELKVVHEPLEAYQKPGLKLVVPQHRTIKARCRKCAGQKAFLRLSRNTVRFQPHMQLVCVEQPAAFLLEPAALCYLWYIEQWLHTTDFLVADSRKIKRAHRHVDDEASYSTADAKIQSQKPSMTEQYTSRLCMLPGHFWCAPDSDVL